MSKLRIGSIGGGGIINAHFPHLATLTDQVELTAIADVNPAAKATAETYNVPNFVTDYKEIFPLVDAVLICVPTHLHSQIAVDALNAGKAVFCEKPMTRTLEQADAILEAQKNSGAPLQVGFVRRFDDEWLAFRDSIQQAKIGRPVIWRDIASGFGPAALWFNTDMQGGGPFLDGCIHNIDFALSTFGPAEWAFCHGRTFRDVNTAIDSGTATVRFQSGDELLLAWSWGLPEGTAGGRIFEFLGPKGTITWPADIGVVSPVPVAGEAEVTQRTFTITNGVDQTETVAFDANALGEGFKKQMDEFVAVAKGEAQPRAGGAEGRESVRVGLAILESARSAQVVKL